MIETQSTSTTSYDIAAVVVAAENLCLLMWPPDDKNKRIKKETDGC